MKAQHYLAVLIFLMFTAAIAAFFKIEPAMGAREPLLILVGSLASNFGMAVSYFFGSTAGSAKKDELIANSVPIETKDGSL